MHTDLSLALAVFLLGGAALAQRAESPRWTLSGRVVAAGSSEPLAGCSVRITGHQATGYPLHWGWLDWRDPEPVVTGADGRFHFALPAMPGRGIGDGYPARIHLYVQAPGRVGVFGSRDFSFFFDEPAQDAGDIPLPNGCARPFRVVDTAGVAQRGVLVYVRPVESLAPSGSWWGYQKTLYERTDLQGLAADGPLPFGKARIEIKGRTFSGPSDVELTPAQGDDASRPIDLVVAPVAAAETIRGRVVDAAGEPVAGYSLYAIGRSSGGDKEEWLATRSAADGTFEVAASGLQLASALRLSHPRNDRYDGWHEFGGHRWGDEGIEVQLLAPAKLQLLVRVAGKPVEDLAVHAVPRQGDAVGADPVRLAGTFRGGVVDLPGLRATRYAVCVHAIGGASWPSEWIELDAGTATEPVVVDLPLPIERKLHIFTTEGLPVLGARVELVVGGKPTWGVWGADYHDRTMTAGGPEGSNGGQRTRPRVADRGTTDRSGAVRLRCLVRDEPVFLVVEGGGAQKTVHELPGWSDDRGPILVSVPGGGELRGAIAPADFVTALDSSPAEEQKRSAQFGLTPNPWRKSLADFRAVWRPQIALREPQGPATQPLPFASIVAEDGTFAIPGVPPGRYEVVLVVRNAVQGRAREEVVAPPLGEVEIRAGEVTPVRYETPAAIVERAAKAR